MHAVIIYLFIFVIYTFLIIYLKNLWIENEHLVKVAENLTEYAKLFLSCTNCSHLP